AHRSTGAGVDLPVGELTMAGLLTRRTGRQPDRSQQSGPHVPPPPTGRGIELLMLGFAAVLVTLALVLVEANQEQELTRGLLYVGAAYLGLFTIAHLVVHRFAPYADPLILPCVALLNGL